MQLVIHRFPNYNGNHLFGGKSSPANVMAGYWLAGKVRSVTLKFIFAASCPLLPLLLMMTAALIICMNENMARNFHAFLAGKFVTMFLIPYFLGIAVYVSLIRRLYKESV